MTDAFMPNQNQTTPTPSPLIISFTGPIKHEATKTLRNLICATAAGQYSELTLLFSSSGGSVDDGFSLYNLLRALPVTVTAVNMASVGSIAVSVFLAADKRIACPGTRFTLHDFTWTPGNKETLTPNRLEERSRGLEHDKAQYRQLLINRCQNLTETSLDEMRLFDKPIIMDATAAQQAGLVDDITQYTIPAGSKVLNVDY